MAIVRWEPARELGSLQQEVNRVFSAFFEPNAGVASARWTPPMDLIEREDSFELLADLPGVSEDALTIEVEGDRLTLSGARDPRAADAAGEYLRAERPTGEFRRQLTLPDGVDAESIKASFDLGVLRIQVPKPVQAKPQRVSIRVGEGASGQHGTAAIEGTASMSDSQSSDGASKSEGATSRATEPTTA